MALREVQDHGDNENEYSDDENSHDDSSLQQGVADLAIITRSSPPLPETPAVQRTKRAASESEFTSTQRKKTRTQQQSSEDRYEEAIVDEHTPPQPQEIAHTISPPLDDATRLSLIVCDHLTKYDPAKALLSITQAATDFKIEKKTSKTTHKGAQVVKRSEVGRGLDFSLPPLSNIYDIFDAMSRIPLMTKFIEACSVFSNQSIRIVTMCSGTESPILGMRLLGDALLSQGVEAFTIDHLASCEIEPQKQAYIQRNFNPPHIFRDVTEFTNETAEPHTAYGGTAKQPTQVHILVAGSSCVDYSHLNSAPKKFGEAGQSYSTMQGIWSYAKYHRPNVVILENVKGAEWDKIVEYWDTIDYHATFEYVDSKDYYIPQTRQRGYLVAFDKQLATTLGFDTTAALTTWSLCMKKFKRRASSPYVEFLYSEDDTTLAKERRTLALSTKPTSKVFDWDACRKRYHAFRSANHLGSMRPSTLR